GLSRENLRIVSSVPVAWPSIVSTGRRRSGISTRASTTLLPAFVALFLLDQRRVFSTTTSRFMFSATGHLSEYLRVPFSPLPATRKLPSPLSKGNASSAPENCMVPAVILPATSASLNQR